MKINLLRTTCLFILLLILVPCDGAWGYVGPGCQPHYFYKVEWISPILVFIIPVTLGLLAACFAAIRFGNIQRYSKIFMIVFIGAFVGAFLGGLVSIFIMDITVSLSWFEMKELFSMNCIQSLLNALIQAVIISMIRMAHDKEFLYLIPTITFYLIPVSLIMTLLGFGAIVVYGIFPLFYLGVIVWGLYSVFVIWRKWRLVQW